jgi:hypothetical protein
MCGGKAGASVRRRRKWRLFVKALSNVADEGEIVKDENACFHFAYAINSFSRIGVSNSWKLAPA